MNRNEALGSLPEPYAKILRLRAQGVGTDVLATCLGVDPAAVPLMLALAEAKLASLMGEES